MSTTSNVVFQEARDSFLASLQPNERSSFSSCDSAADLLRDVEKFHVITKDRRRGQKILAKVRAFTDNLSPYFDVIGIIVQCHPESAGIAWGALRLVLQLASNYATFFTKFAGSLEVLAPRIPRYEELLKNRAGYMSDRLKQTLREFYLHLIQYFESVIRIFTKKDGTTRRGAFVITDLFWKPFNVRFEDLLERLARQSQIINDEILFATYQEFQPLRDSLEEEKLRSAEARKLAMEQRQATEEILKFQEEMILHYKKEEQQWKKTSISKIKEWLQPTNFAEEFERACELREEGTGDWLFEEEEFKKWLQHDDIKSKIKSTTNHFVSDVLWVSGNPGCGKTILASATIEELQAITSSQVVYFFFRAEISLLDLRITAFRAILAQILHQHRHDPEVIDQFAFIMDEYSSGQLVASKNELLDLFRVCNNRIGRTIVILDGIDECEDASGLLQDLGHLAANTDLKFCLFSRPNIGSLLSPFSKYQIAVGRSTCPDIRLFLSRKLQSLVEKGQINTQRAPLSTLEERLTTGANGMFLWARLVIILLQSLSLTPSRRLDIIASVTMPEGLHAMYDRIISLIIHGQQPDRELAKRATSWLCLSKRELTIRELRAALNTADPSAALEEDYSDEDFERAVLAACAGLVEAGESIQGPCLRFIHLSAQEYFLHAESTRPSQEENTQRLINIGECYLYVARICLEFLISRVSVSPSGQVATTQKSANLVPFHSYAAIYWINHLNDTVPSNGDFAQDARCSKSYIRPLFDSLHQFLSQPFAIMSWIETCYTCECVPSSEQLRGWAGRSAQLEAIVQSHNYTKTVQDSADLAEYLVQLDTDWTTHLFQDPSAIWDEITAFTPGRLLAQTSATVVNYLTTQNPQNNNLSSKALCEISESSADGNLVGVLSVWPSRSYEELALVSSSDQSFDKLLNCSTGWVARYLVWSTTQPPQRVAEFRIPLDALEVEMQMHHSLWRKKTGKEKWLDETHEANVGDWRLQFPLSISLDLHLIAVLRTVYAAQFKKTTSSVRIESSKIPLDFNERIKDSWCSDQRRPKRDHGISPEFTLSARTLRQDLYLYWISFSSDGKYLLFVDQEIFQSNQAVLFEIDHQEKLLLEPIVSQHTGTYEGPEQLARKLHVAFHSDKMLLVFSLARKIYSLHCIDNKFILDLLHRCEDFLQGLQFSTCGAYVVANKRSGPTVFSIPTAILSHSDPRAQPSLESHLHTPSLDHGFLAAIEAQTVPANKHPSSDTIVAGGSLKPTIKAGEVQTGLDNSMATSLSQIDGTITLHRGQRHFGPGTYEDEEGLEITKLPQWALSETTGTSIKLPEQGDTAIKVMLNRNPTTFSGLSEVLDRPPPAVVHRSLGHIFANAKRKREMLLEDAGDSDDDDDDNNDIDEASRPKARKHIGD